MLTVHAPGRVNLIGEHTDTTGGLVLPVAIDRYVTVEARPTSDGTTHLVSDALPGAVVLDGDGTPRDDSAPWGRYAAAVWRQLEALGRPRRGIEGRVRSTIPPGAGLSSSAGLEVALALALLAAGGMELEPRELALACQRAEHDAVGVPCGPMDQLASTLGVEGHALRIDCATLALDPVPLPPGVGILVVDSGIGRRLEQTPYARRHAELAAGHPARLRHVTTENKRVDEVCALLAAPDPDRAAVGAVLRAGHESLVRDFEVSTPEIDLLVELLLDAGAFAARLTGAGFGGCVVALVEADALAVVGHDAVTRFSQATQLAAVAHACRAVDGAARDGAGV